VAEIRDELVEAWTRLHRLRGGASPPPPDLPMI
jgi:hypothetical protein